MSLSPTRYSETTFAKCMTTGDYSPTRTEYHVFQPMPNRLAENYSRPGKCKCNTPSKLHHKKVLRTTKITGVSNGNPSYLSKTAQESRNNRLECTRRLRRRPIGKNCKPASLGEAIFHILAQGFASSKFVDPRRHRNVRTVVAKNRS